MYMFIFVERSQHSETHSETILNLCDRFFFCLLKSLLIGRLETTDCKICPFYFHRKKKIKTHAQIYKLKHLHKDGQKLINQLNVSIISTN